MKKLLLLSMLLFGTITFAQETFIIKYSYYSSKEKQVFSELKECDVTVVFNEKDTNDIVVYLTNGKIWRYKKVGNVIKDYTFENKEPYQIIDCLDSENGYRVALQFFEKTSTLRIIMGVSYFVEFYI